MLHPGKYIYYTKGDGSGGIEEQKDNIQETNRKIVAINPTLSVNTFNVVTTHSNQQTESGRMDKKIIQLYAVYKRQALYSKTKIG